MLAVSHLVQHHATKKTVATSWTGFQVNQPSRLTRTFTGFRSCSNAAGEVVSITVFPVFPDDVMNSVSSRDVVSIAPNTQAPLGDQRTRHEAHSLQLVGPPSCQ